MLTVKININKFDLLLCDINEGSICYVNDLSYIKCYFPKDTEKIFFEI